MGGGAAAGAAAPFVNGQRQKETICRRQMALKRNAAGGLLTHHQPNGRSPALEKGGYVARRAGALVQMALKRNAAGGC